MKIMIFRRGCATIFEVTSEQNVLFHIPAVLKISFSCVEADVHVYALNMNSLTKKFILKHAYGCFCLNYWYIAFLACNEKVKIKMVQIIHWSLWHFSIRLDSYAFGKTFFFNLLSGMLPCILYEYAFHSPNHVIQGAAY